MSGVANMHARKRIPPLIRGMLAPGVWKKSVTGMSTKNAVSDGRGNRDADRAERGPRGGGAEDAPDEGQKGIEDDRHRPAGGGDHAERGGERDEEPRSATKASPSPARTLARQMSPAAGREGVEERERPGLALGGEDGAAADHPGRDGEHERREPADAEVADDVRRRCAGDGRVGERRRGHEHAAAEHDQGQRDQPLLAEFLPDDGADHAILSVPRQRSQSQTRPS